MHARSPSDKPFSRVAARKWPAATASTVSNGRISRPKFEERVTGIFAARAEVDESGDDLGGIDRRNEPATQPSRSDVGTVFLENDREQRRTVEDRRSFFSPQGASFRQELIDDALPRLLELPHPDLYLSNRNRRGNKTKLSSFHPCRYPTILSQDHRLRASREGSGLDRPRPTFSGCGSDCSRSALRMMREPRHSRASRGSVLLPVLILGTSRVPVAVLGYVTLNDLTAFRTPTLLTGDFIGDFPNPPGQGTGVWPATNNWSNGCRIQHVYLRNVETSVLF